MKIIRNKTYDANVVETSERLSVFYEVIYYPIVYISIVLFGKPIFSKTIRKKPIKSKFTFAFQRWAESYISNIEKPEIVPQKKFIFVGNYDIIPIYPKGWERVKQFGYFVYHKIPDGHHTNMASNVQFAFYDQEKYGKTFSFGDYDFFDHIEEHIDSMIKIMHLDIPENNVVSSVTLK